MAEQQRQTQEAEVVVAAAVVAVAAEGVLLTLLRLPLHSFKA